MKVKTYTSAVVFGTLGLLIPIHSYAFGLGKIQVYSALNEPFKAKIPVMALRDDDKETLQVKLASTQEFDKAGIDRSYLLTQLKFKVTKENGKTIISVSSDKPVKEPFLDFLIIANTETGRLIREYTALLDPPVTVSNHFESRTDDVAKKQTTTQKAQIEVKPISEETKVSGWPSNTYHVNSNDTLLSIANKTKPDASISTNQMMIALLKANESAFINHNINQLKAGVTLTIPGISEITSMSKQQARAAVIAQYEEWKHRHKNKTVVAQSHNVSNDNNTKIEDIEDQVQQDEGAQQDKGAHLKLVVPTNDDSVTNLDEPSLMGDKKLTKLAEQLTLAQETIESQAQENKEIKARMKLMEEQIQTLKRLISLKDTDLAKLQQALQEKSGQQQSDLAGPEDTNTETVEDTEPTVINENNHQETESEQNIELQNNSDQSGQESSEDAVMEGTKQDVLSNSGELEVDTADQSGQESSEDAVMEGTKQDALSDSGELEVDTADQNGQESSEDAVMEGTKQDALSNPDNVDVGENVSDEPQSSELAVHDEIPVQSETQEEYYARIIAMNRAVENTEKETDTSLMNDSSTAAEMDEQPQEDEKVMKKLPDSFTEVSTIENESIISKIKRFYVQHRNGSLIGGLVALLLLIFLIVRSRRNREEFEWEQEDDAQDIVDADRIEQFEKADSVRASSEQTDVKPSVSEKKENITEVAPVIQDIKTETENSDFNRKADESAVLAAYDSLEDEIDKEQPEDQVLASDELNIESVASFDQENETSNIHGHDIDVAQEQQEIDNLELNSDISIEEKEAVDEDLHADLLDYDVSSLAESEDDEKLSDNNIDFEDALTMELKGDNIDSSSKEQSNQVSPETMDAEVINSDLTDDEINLDLGEFDDIDETETKLDLASAYIDMGDPDGARNILEEVINEGNEHQQARAKTLLDKLG